MYFNIFNPLEIYFGLPCEVVISLFLGFYYRLLIISPWDLKYPSYHELNSYMFFLPAYVWVRYHSILIIVVLESILISICAQVPNISVL